MSSIRLLLVEDHEIVRAGLRALLSRHDDIDVVGEAATGEEGVELATELSPDVVLMDVSLPGMSGDEATGRILAQVPRAHVLVLSVHEEDAYFFRMLRAGACGYVPKRAAPEHLVTAIRAASSGEVFLDPLVADKLVDACVGEDGLAQTGRTTDGLTQRQEQVLALLADGLSSSQIGEALGISPSTVQRHRANIESALNLHGDADLVKYAVRKGLIELR